MKLNLDELTYDAKWYDLETLEEVKEMADDRVYLKVRPYPQHKSNMQVRDGAIEITGQRSLDMFLYCLVDWKGVVGGDDQPLKCTESVKKKIFDFNLGGLTSAVSSIGNRFFQGKEASEKNL